MIFYRIYSLLSTVHGLLLKRRDTKQNGSLYAKEKMKPYKIFSTDALYSARNPPHTTSLAMTMT